MFTDMVIIQVIASLSLTVKHQKSVEVQLDINSLYLSHFLVLQNFPETITKPF